jgi:two-component system CheB/CheR fusion protein
VAGGPQSEPIRVWSAGCSSGEEAYTLAMALAEVMGPEAFKRRVKIYATDIDEGALAQARAANYGPKDLEPVPPELRGKYFETVGSRFVFRNDLRRVVIFGRNDLAQDAPISHLDLLVCRNTLMYFTAETQQRVLNRLHFALASDGFMFLGRAEMLLTHANLFCPVSMKHRVFSKVPSVALRERVIPLAMPEGLEVGNRVAQVVRLREAAFESSAAAHVVVDLNDALAMANQRARELFGLGPRDIGRPFRDLEVSFRPVELRSIIEEAAKTRRPARLSEVRWETGPDDVRYLDVEVTPLQSNGGNLVGVSVTFADVTYPVSLKEQLARSNQELETAYEELQSSNEELETTNEELQSTNEELETMNEELQSTNEELQTMNDELRTRTEEINYANAFLQSILTGLDEGVVALDRQLAVSSWNDKAADMWGLRADEVHGQSLLGLDIGLPLETLKNPIRTVLAGESNSEVITVDATNRRGKAIKCQVTLTPRIGPDKEVMGVILLMAGC